MKLTLGFMFIWLLTSYIDRSPALSNSISIDDSAFVAIDSSTINKSENTFDYVLFFESDNKRYEIYREKNQDYSVEVKYISTYKTESLDFEQFSIADLPTGRSRDIIRDKHSNTFYLTDWYDDLALGDLIIKSTADFTSRRIKIKSVDSHYPDYQVRLAKIWEPSSGNRSNTKVKN